MYNDLDKAKHRYKSSFLKWEDSQKNYTKADTGGTLSLCDFQRAQCDNYNGAYASQLMKTNACQVEYYYKELLGVCTPFCVLTPPLGSSCFPDDFL